MEKEKRINENIAVIGLTAGYLIAENLIEIGDSILLHNEIIHLGHEFEALFSIEELDGDYINIIDNYAKKKLIEYFS